MDYRPRARRYCSWRPYRLLPALRADALSCSGRCRMAAHRAAHELRDAYREESGGLPGRDGYPDGEAARSWPRRARIGDRLKALSSASQTKPSRRSWRRGG